MRVYSRTLIILIILLGKFPHDAVSALLFFAVIWTIADVRPFIAHGTVYASCSVEVYVLSSQFAYMMMHECRGLCDEYEVMPCMAVGFHRGKAFILDQAAFCRRGIEVRLLAFVINYQRAVWGVAPVYWGVVYDAWVIKFFGF